jgi:hypothetical protein
VEWPERVDDWQDAELLGRHVVTAVTGRPERGRTSMGIEDIVNQAKDALGLGEQKADAAAADAAAGNTEAAQAEASEASSMIDKAKELLTDERIDSATGAIKGLTPDSVDGAVDSVAEKAKDWNN